MFKLIIKQISDLIGFHDLFFSGIFSQFKIGGFAKLFVKSYMVKIHKSTDFRKDALHPINTVESAVHVKIFEVRIFKPLHHSLCTSPKHTHILSFTFSHNKNSKVEVSTSKVLSWDLFSIICCLPPLFQGVYH